MKIAVVGAGGVGGYIGAKLMHAKDADVTIVARGAHLHAIKAQGLHVNDEGHDFWLLGENFTENPAAEGVFDIVIFCTKSYDLEEAAWHMSPCIDENTLLFALCNGVEHEITLQNIYPHNPVASACIYILSNIVKPGHIKKYGGVFLMLVGSSPIHPSLHEFVLLCEKADMKTKISKDIRLDCWLKYLFISAFGTMSAYYDQSIGMIVEQHHEEVRSLLSEIVAVANAKGITLNENNIDQAMDQALHKVPYDATTSMQLDVRNQKKTEVEALCGYIAKEGKALHVNTPIMTSLYQKLSSKL